MLSRKPLGYFATEFKYELEILRRSGRKVKSRAMHGGLEQAIVEFSHTALNPEEKKGGVSSKLTPRVNMM
jgi:hypothetical protein